MAIVLDSNSITEDIHDLIIKECNVKKSKTQYDQNPGVIECYTVMDDGVYIPLGLWKKFLDEFPDPYPIEYVSMSKEVKCKKEMYTIASDPKGYRDQDVVVSEALEKLEEDHTVFLACPPGFGKTSCGNYLACTIGLKTLVVCHISTVNKQWLEEFRDFSTAKVQLVKGNTLDPDADVYIMGIQKISNMDKAIFDSIGIGTVIFDEAHVATITAFSASLLKITPKYVIGLSATPDVSADRQRLISMYFGPKQNYIVREETKEFVVYKYETDFEPEINYKILYGSTVLDWTGVLNSLAYNEDRHSIICNLVTDIALADPNNRIMVLSDRIFECQGIYRLLIDTLGEDIVYYMDDAGSKANINLIKRYQVLIAGRKKAGIGFNDPTRNNLVLCTDCKDVRQNEGRIRTVNNNIYDIVDCFSTLENHWNLREEWYIQRGAQIVTWNRSKTVLRAGRPKKGGSRGGGSLWSEEVDQTSIPTRFLK